MRFWSWVCGTCLVVVSFMALVGMPPSEMKPHPTAFELWLSETLFPVALVGMAWAVLALGAVLRRRPRGALYLGVACLVTFQLAGFAADRITVEGGWANGRTVAVLFLPFVLGLYSAYRRHLTDPPVGADSTADAKGHEHRGA